MFFMLAAHVTDDPHVRRWIVPVGGFDIAFANTMLAHLLRNPTRSSNNARAGFTSTLSNSNQNQHTQQQPINHKQRLTLKSTSREAWTENEKNQNAHAHTTELTTQPSSKAEANDIELRAVTSLNSATSDQLHLDPTLQLPLSSAQHPHSSAASHHLISDTQSQRVETIGRPGTPLPPSFVPEPTIETGTGTVALSSNEQEHQVASLPPPPSSVNVVIEATSSVAIAVDPSPPFIHLLLLSCHHPLLLLLRSLSLPLPLPPPCLRLSMLLNPTLPSFLIQPPLTLLPFNSHVEGAVGGQWFTLIDSLTHTKEMGKSGQQQETNKRTTISTIFFFSS